jgi:Uma2 family endonuclease
MIAKAPPFRFTVDQYDQMIENGILTEDNRVELIRGEIVAKMAIGDAHSACVDRLNWRLNRAIGARGIVRVQNPIVLADSEPEPDISIVNFRADFYENGRPSPDDVLLVIEVGDTTFEWDRDEKAPLYAENAIPEYWIIDLNTDTVLVYRNPQPDGSWATVTTHGRGDVLTVAALPTVTVAVADILP